MAFYFSDYLELCKSKKTRANHTYKLETNFTKSLIAVSIVVLVCGICDNFIVLITCRPSPVGVNP
jgi:hypothetical protein